MSTSSEDMELLNQYSVEANTSVGFGGLFSALTVFFAGLLITSYDSFPIQVRVPLLFLIISTFGFVYSTLIYANASGMLTLKKLNTCKKALNTADVLSEILGVFPLLISIPLVIPMVSSDLFLIVSVMAADAVGMIMYQLSGYSILHDYFPRAGVVLVALIIGFMSLMLLLLESSYQGLLSLFVVLTLAALFLMTLLTIRKLPSVE